VTTFNYSSVLSHTDDASFRAWGSELSAAFTSVGLTKTADTGQIDWLTVARPGTSTDAGYEIWRFNDAAQATHPIFFKLYYGTGTTATYPRMWAQVGQGSDGAGNLTGSTFGSTPSAFFGTNVTAPSAPASGSRPSYLCYNTTYGCFTLFWKLTSPTASACHGFFSIARTSNVDGTPNDEGWAAVFLTGGSNDDTPSGVTFSKAGDVWANFNFSTTSSRHGYVFMPGLWNSSGGLPDPLASVGFVSCRTTYPVIAWCGHWRNDFIAGQTFQATLLGSTPVTYMSTLDTGGHHAVGWYTNSTIHGPGFAFLYE
jgi:hypothetical protein